MKYLIINADDFGMSKVFNVSILDLLKQGKITSTSVLVNRITQDQKNQVNDLIQLSKSMDISVGLHLDFETLEQDKYYEILFHPGTYDPHSKSSLNKERERDVTHILKLNTLLKKYSIKLVSYHDLAIAV